MSGDPLERIISEALGEPIAIVSRVSGGDINQAARAATRGGGSIFVKWNPRQPRGMFAEEARGLRALREADGCRVPEVLAVGDGAAGGPAFLALEWIESGSPAQAHAEALGRGLARQHRATAARFGFHADNFIGSTPQPNAWEEDLVTFFRDRRLGFQHELLRTRGRSSPALDRRLDALRARLHEWLTLPSERPALLHGDLWGGNVMTGPVGEPVLIDPAAHYGCREADLAMTELFGGFPRGFLQAYEEAAPLEPGYEERRDLYNLYHVLNHANLFGGGYAGSAERMCRRYVG